MKNKLQTRDFGGGRMEKRRVKVAGTNKQRSNLSEKFV